MSDEFVARLLAAVSEDRRDAGVAVEAVYRPAGDGKVMPPSYPDGPYLYESRWVDGEKREVVVLDQAPSQANRVEEALLSARDKGQIELPMFELTAKTTLGVVRLTSLQFPHRYADAYLRDSQVGGVRFDGTPYGRRLREASSEDARPLYERDPVSLILGAWDSHRKGRWPKFPRVYCSSVTGLDPAEGVRRGSRMDPLNLTGAIDDKAKAEADWRYLPPGEKKVKGQKLSEIGHGNVVTRVGDKAVHGGVAVTAARRSAWLSLAGLERLRFGDAPAEAVVLARAALAALALAGDRLAFGRPSVWLRSGCDLVRVSEVLAFEQDLGRREAFELTADEAVGAFGELRDRAAAAGIAMATDTVALEPIPALAAAIEYSFTQAVPAEAADTEE